MQPNTAGNISGAGGRIRRILLVEKARLVGSWQIFNLLIETRLPHLITSLSTTFVFNKTTAIQFCLYFVYSLPLTSSSLNHIPWLHPLILGSFTTT